MDRTSWTLAELWSDLEVFEKTLVRAGLRQQSVRTYVDRTKFFLRWLAGDYQPRGPQQ